MIRRIAIILAILVATGCGTVQAVRERIDTAVGDYCAAMPGLARVAARSTVASILAESGLDLSSYSATTLSGHQITVTGESVKIDCTI